MEFSEESINAALALLKYGVDNAPAIGGIFPDKDAIDANNQYRVDYALALGDAVRELSPDPLVAGNFWYVVMHKYMENEEELHRRNS